MSCIYNPLCEAVGVCSSVAVRLADEDEGTWWPGTARREGWRREFAWFDAGGSRLTLERRNRSGEVERSVLLDSIRCDGAHSSFLLNTAEGSGDLQESRHRPWLTRLRDLTNRGGHDMRAKQGRGVKTGERQRSNMLRECQRRARWCLFFFFFNN